MRPLTLKQRCVIFVVGILECIVNSQCLIGLLNRMSRCVFRSAGRPNESSMFRGLKIAFIADGNRRYHRKKWADNGEMCMRDAAREACREGTAVSALGGEHKMKDGFLKVLELIKFGYFNCFREISFYCFSIKNFQRGRKEVDDIMRCITENKDVDLEVPVKVVVYGRLELLDPQVRRALEAQVEKTRDSSGLVVNLFFSYSSSSEEMDGTEFSSGVDLVIRTGNVRRLSDFMVRQVSSGAAVDFVAPLWPEFSLAHCWLVLLKYKLEIAYLDE